MIPGVQPKLLLGFDTEEPFLERLKKEIENERSY